MRQIKKISETHSTEEDFYTEVKRSCLAPLWLQRGSKPYQSVVPHLWKWSEIRPKILRAVDATSTVDAERRVLGLVNPSFIDSGKFATTPTLIAAIQIIMPGEVAVAHHHTAAALRIIMEGKGGYTVTDGEQCWMEPGDLILTPSWTFHDHAHQGEGPMIWLDGLDAPLMGALDARFFERFPEERQQPITQPDDASTRRFAAAGLRPAAYRWDKPYSPLTKYPWQHTVEALNKMGESEATPFDDLYLEFINPHTGGPVMPTIGAYAQKLRAGTYTKSHRHIPSVVYYIFRGSGVTKIEGERFSWSAGDILVLPGWHWHEHSNSSKSEDAILLSFTDEPVLRSLGIYREESRQ